MPSAHLVTADGRRITDNTKWVLCSEYQRVLVDLYMDIRNGSGDAVAERSVCIYALIRLTRLGPAAPAAVTARVAARVAQLDRQVAAAEKAG